MAGAAASLSEKMSPTFNFWGSYLPGRMNEKLIERALEAKKEFRAEATNRRKDGTKYLTELRVFPILDQEGKPKLLIGLERNITPEKELDNTKTDFISLASHQLRTPLTNMSLSVEVLLRDPSGHLSDYQKDCLKGIHGEIHKMADLIATLLDVSKIQLGNFVVERKPVDIIQAAESALERLLPEIIGKSLKLIKSFDSSVPRVLSDKNIILVVLENLLSNAIKYTPPKGLMAFVSKNKRTGSSSPCMTTAAAFRRANSTKSFPNTSGPATPVNGRRRAWVWDSICANSS